MPRITCIVLLAGLFAIGAASIRPVYAATTITVNTLNDELNADGEIVWTSRGAGDASADRVTVRGLGKTARRVALPDLAHVDRAGSLAAFVKAIEAGQESGTSGRDNLGSIALMRALIESAASGLPMPVPQVTA